MTRMSALESTMDDQMKLMDDQTKLMEAVERSLVEYHQKQNTTYADYVMKEKEIVKNMNGKLDVLSGDMDQLKILVSKISCKINKIVIDVD